MNTLTCTACEALEAKLAKLELKVNDLEHDIIVLMRNLKVKSQ